MAGDTVTMSPHSQMMIHEASGLVIGPADDMILGFHTVFKNYYLQGLHQSSDIGELLINKTVWNKLTPDLKAVIETAVMATIAETYTYNVHKNAAALQKLMTEHKVVVQDTPKEFFTAFMKATNANANMIPAAPRASRSFKTRTG